MDDSLAGAIPVTGGPGRRPRPRGRPSHGPPADDPAAADLGLLARPDRHRRGRRPVHHQPPRVRRARARGRRRQVDVRDRRGGGDRGDHHPAHRRLHQRLHRVALGPAQAVHRRSARCSTSCSCSGSRSNSLLVLAAFMLLLSVSTNIARGPFQGYVPDLVAEPQVGHGERHGRDDAGRRQRDGRRSSSLRGPARRPAGSR